ncbi:MAG TPA: UdgX family uracil-DNA binding protein, partial [Phycisphaerae bacterium]|nr:UdgX family uracil-DNA binding protein [Phycisphaerae bacterium]
DPEYPSAAAFLPPKKTIPALRAAAKSCEGCPLHLHATQTVFGEGPAGARILFIGEQPGDQEDLRGRPFVGPAGRLLDEALEEAGIKRSETFMTNAVKHFKFEMRGKRRLHAKPRAREIEACRPWLDAEIAAVKPRLIVCLGATAAQAMMGRAFRITKERGKVFKPADGPWIMATVHPSSILRAPDDESRRQAKRDFIKDLKKAASALES